MKKIFAGLIFILFNVHVTLGGYMIGLLPDFVGYLLVAAGLKEVWQEEGVFENLVPLALELAVFTGVIYLIRLLPMTRREGLLAVLDVLATLCFLVMVYKIVGGVKALGEKASVHAEHKKADAACDWLRRVQCGRPAHRPDRQRAGGGGWHHRTGGGVCLCCYVL